MKTFPEGKLTFIFDDTWECVHWDKSREYRHGIHRLDHTKAVDFLGIREEKLFLIEVRDFRGHRIENKARQAETKSSRPPASDASVCQACGHQAGTQTCPEHDTALSLEVGRKVRDTIAGIVGSSIGQRNDTFVGRCARILGDDRRASAKIRVLAWVLEDPPPVDARALKKWKADQGVQRNWLKHRLAWLTPRVEKANPLVDSRVYGVTVRGHKPTDAPGESAD